MKVDDIRKILVVGTGNHGAEDCSSVRPLRLRGGRL